MPQALIDNLLVPTKFAPPRISAKAVPRAKLLKELRHAKDCSVCIIVGAPGFGKTTLLAQWRLATIQTGAEVAWLSLSSSDKSLPTFYAYLQGALQQVGISLDHSPELDGFGGQAFENVVAAIIEGVRALGKELYFVLDDYQHIMDPRSHKLMQTLIDHCPDNLHIVLASRAAPPLSLGRLRVRGQVLELDCAILPFELSETRRFFEQNMGTPKLTEEELHFIQDLSGGWPASLQLMLLMLRGRPESRLALRDLGWQSDDLQDYLSEDVMSHLPAELAEFMESLSICRRFNAPMAAAITGNARAADLLARMEEENILVFRVEAYDRHVWLRFHPLFGEFLAKRLARRGSPAIAELHRRAALWLAEQGLLAEAVHHSVESGDLDLAMDIIEREAHQRSAIDFLKPLVRLLSRLPPQALLQRPRLCVLYCLSCSWVGQHAKVLALLDKLQSHSHSPDLVRNLPVVQASVYTLNDQNDKVLEALADYVPCTEDHLTVRHTPLTLLMLAYVATRTPEEALQRIAHYPLSFMPDDEIALLHESTQQLCKILGGHISEIDASSTELLGRAITLYGHNSISAHIIAAVTAEVHRERNRVDEAREALANRTDVMQSALPSLMLISTLCRARLDLQQESPALAMAFLERQALHFRNNGQDRLLSHVLAEQQRIALLVKDLTGASRYSAQLEVLANLHRQSRGFLAEIPVLAAQARARLLLVNAQPEQALEALGTVLAFARTHERGQQLVTALLLSAQALDDLRKPADMLAALREALEQGLRLGLLRTFIDEGDTTRRLLAGAATKLATPALGSYLKELLEHFHAQEASKDAVHTQKAPGNPLLTPRELAILELIGKAMSNKRIALTLSISLETVKWNLKNIYSKLGVSSRYDAAAWARSHQLII